MYRRPICDPASLAMIKDIEQQLLEKKCAPNEENVTRARKRFGLPVSKDQGDEWEQIFQDPLDEAGRTTFVIPSLLVNSKPMIGTPDVVYRSLKTREILIVEIKASNKSVPTNG